MAKADEEELRPAQTTQVTADEAKAQRQARKEESLAASGGEYPDTPSGKALAAVGDLDGEDAESSEAAAEQGEKYAAEKRKYRWGY